VSWIELAVVAGSVFAAAMVQVLSGFGFALLCVPLMALAVDAKEAVVISTLLGAGVSTWQAWHGRAHTERAVARRMILGAYLGMPVGLLVFLRVDDRVLRLLLGVAVLVAVVLLAVRLDLRHAGSRLDTGAGFLSGVLNTSLSTNGPPLVFVLQARHLAPDAFRATITTVFAFSNVLGVSLFVASGKVDRDGLVAAGIALPALFLGQVSGYPLRRHVAGERFRVLVLLLLTAAAVSAIVSALG
jgi:uncharacterized membrane protein YfcA